jgi:hypothetical protein
MMWKCTTCDLEFDGIPDAAVRLTHSNSRTNVFRFSDGSIHALRKLRSPKSESVLPAPEPLKEATELLQSVVQVLAELPQPEPVKPEATEPEIEGDGEMLTPMALAFLRSKKFAA